MSIELLIFIVFVAICVLWVVPATLYLTLGWFKFFYHDVLEWHRPDNSPLEFDGCSYHSVCKYCGKRIMQDSQGNWF